MAAISVAVPLPPVGTGGSAKIGKSIRSIPCFLIAWLHMALYCSLRSIKSRSCGTVCGPMNVSSRAKTSLRPAGRENQRSAVAITHLTSEGSFAMLKRFVMAGPGVSPGLMSRNAEAPGREVMSVSGNRVAIHDCRTTVRTSVGEREGKSNL